jgi:Ca2+-binding RTX toxin-like protein
MIVARVVVGRVAAGVLAAGAIGLSVGVPAAPAAAGGGVTVSVSAGELTIIGTALNDFINVDRVMSGSTVVAYRVTDDRPLLAGPGCAVATVPTEVRCSPIGVTSVYAWLDADEDAYADATGLNADVYGGDANDVISIDGIGGFGLLAGGSGDDRIFAGTGDSTMFGGPGNDLLFGSFGQDYISGGDGEDQIDGSDSSDVLSGGSGFDIVSYAYDPLDVMASLDGASGNDGHAGEGDTILADVEGLAGSAGNDYLSGNAGPNWIFGGAGQDVIDGASGPDEIEGGADTDWLVGGYGADRIIGSEGNDFLLGGDHDDQLYGGPGRDSLVGGLGLDQCVAGDGEPTTGCEL